MITAEHQLMGVKIPDVSPGGLTADFSMVAGDFIEVYSAEDQKGCVAKQNHHPQLNKPRI